MAAGGGNPETRRPDNLRRLSGSVRGPAATRRPASTVAALSTVMPCSCGPAAAGISPARGKQRAIAFVSQATLQSESVGTQWAAAGFGVQRIHVEPIAHGLLPAQPPAFDGVRSSSDAERPHVRGAESPSITLVDARAVGLLVSVA
jgi:hypothetical protein